DRALEWLGIGRQAPSSPSDAAAGGLSAGKEQTPSQAAQLVAPAGGCALFHPPHEKAVATIGGGGAGGQWANPPQGCKGRRGRGGARGAARGVGGGRPRWGGRRPRGAPRLTGRGGAFSPARAAKVGRAARTPPGGGGIAPAPPVRFRRTRGMLALPEPVE